VGKFNDSGMYAVEDDPFEELFADCDTPEQVAELQAEIDEAEASARKS
jgi:hypothetical protein